MHPPSSWLKSPIRALVLTQILGQPCEFQVGGETKLWAARETQNLRQHLSFFEASIRRNCVRTVLVSVPSASAPCDPIKRLVPWSSWRLLHGKLTRLGKTDGSKVYSNIQPRTPQYTQHTSSHWVILVRLFCLASLES